MKKSPAAAPDLSHIHADLRALAVPLDSLVLDPENARVHNVRNLAAIAESLKRFGFRAPIVVQRAGMIVRAGNGRCAAALQLGWTHVPALLVDDTSQNAILYALSDNRTAELASWDDARLAEIIDSLEGESLETGWLWSKGEVDEIVANLSDPAPAPTVDGEEDLAPPAPTKTRTKRGDLLVLGRHRVLCGDSTSARDVARVLNGESPGLMITDPPYGVEYDAAWRNRVGLSSTAQTGKVANDDRASWAAAWNHFPGDVAYVWHAGLFACSVARSLEVAGLELRSQIVWVKRRFAISRGAYHWRHEPAWFCVRKGAKARWIGGRKQDTVWADVVDSFAGDENQDLFAARLSPDSVYAFAASSTTVWELPGDAAVGGGHSTQKPVEAMARPMRNHSVDGVYDPFLGTGTTLVAAEQEGKRCFGLEIDPAYCDVIVRRWEALTGKKATRTAAPKARRRGQPE